MDIVRNENTRVDDAGVSEFERQYIRREVMKAYRAVQDGEPGMDLEEFVAELRGRRRMN